MEIVLLLQPVNQPLTKDVNVDWLDKTIFFIKMDLVKYVQDKYITKKEFPEFKAGDTITVYYEIKEGAKTRTQFFKGTVIQLRGTGLTKTFTIRKMSGDVGVERVFPLNMPALQKIELDRRGKVKRARIYYFRNLRGKKARIKDAAYKK
jgi:large subunit ribosomal protein L19